MTTERHATPGSVSTDDVRALARDSQDRLQLWSAFLNAMDARRVAEIGVYRGAFAAHVLARCPALETYYMLDPWRHLDDWNKPANRDDDAFERIFEKAMDATSEHAGRRVVLRGRTTEIIDRIPDGSLDFAYVDGDHSLRGITIDLVRVYGKVREGGWIGGDDFSHTIWQHGPRYEPTLVYPFAIYFAEAVGARLFALRHNQFLLEKRSDDRFEFVDLTARYRHPDLLSQMTSRSSPAFRRRRGKPSLLRRVRNRLVR